MSRCGARDSVEQWVMPQPKTDLPYRFLGMMLLASVPAAAAFASPGSKPPEPALPAGQVWQCTVNGQKTFSDKRCGAGASVRQINDINRMDPTPATSVHFYGSDYSNYPSSGAEAGERAAGDDSEQIFSTPPVIVNRPGIAPRLRPRPHSQGHR
jgi:hypothetical protein